GIPADVIWDSQNQVYWVQVSHCWVKVDITGQGSWYVFDPAMKTYTFTSPITDLTAATGYSQTTLESALLSGTTVTADYFQNLNIANMKTQMDTMASNLINWIKTNKPDATVNDLLGGKSIVQVTGQQRITSLPYQDSSVTPTEWTDIPDAYKTTLQVQYDTINVSFFSQDIAASRLTLTFNGLNQGELRLDGTLIATSS